MTVGNLINFQMLWAFMAGGGAYIFASRHFLSVSLGAGLITLNLLFFAWAGKRIFLKKSIALAASVIVFKYAILGAILFQALSSEKVNALAFLTGICTLVPAVMSFGLSQALNKLKV